MHLSASKYFLFTLIFASLQAQSLLTEISSGDPVLSDQGANFFQEKVEIISRSGKVFILTNSNKNLGPGDFITMTFGQERPIARAVVAKNHNGLSGIKVMKVYSLANWNQLAKGKSIQIIKGDDSFLFAPKVEKKEDEEVVKIDGEKDLYDQGKLLEGDSDLLDVETRNIRTDNIISATFGQETVKNSVTNSSERSLLLNFGWSYQFLDNVWADVTYTRLSLENFPATSTQTLINSFGFRVKYSYSLPFYSYILPYVGYEINSVSSPNAGDDPTTVDEERKLVEDLGEDIPVFGVTFLKRLVPGWFFAANLGNDQITAGIAIEF